MKTIGFMDNISKLLEKEKVHTLFVDAFKVKTD